MALMHPMYNHLGRSKRRREKKTASLLEMRRNITSELESMGYNKKPKRTNNTMITVDYHTEKPPEKKKTTITPNWVLC